MGIYGVDLGTSNCRIAKYDHGELIKTGDRGQSDFPSIIHFEDLSSINVGYSAMRPLIVEPEACVEYTKVRLGKEESIDINVKGDKLSFSPQYITSLFLRHYSNYYKENMKNVVLTVPASYNEIQIKATIQAAKMEGLEVIKVIEEPTAAMFSYLHSLYHRYGEDTLSPHLHKTFMVVDFGGGTLDISLVNIGVDEQGDILPKVLYKEGSTQIGGMDIDFMLMEYVLEALVEITRSEFAKEVKECLQYYRQQYRYPEEISLEARAFLAELKERIERVKIRLSTKQDARLNLNDISDFNNLPITRFDLNKVMGGRFLNTIEHCLQKTINESILRTMPIDKVLVIGGSSKIPLIRQSVKRVAGRLEVIYPKEHNSSVASGAAIIGGINSGDHVKPFSNRSYHSCVSHDLLIQFEGGSPETLLKQGEAIPKEVLTREFTINYALKESINFIIKENYNDLNHRGDGDFKRVEKEIQSIRLYHPFFYKNDRIEVRLQLTQLGIWKVEATHALTNEKIDFHIEENQVLKTIELGGEKHVLFKEK